MRRSGSASNICLITTAHSTDTTIIIDKKIENAPEGLSSNCFSLLQHLHAA